MHKLRLNRDSATSSNDGITPKFMDMVGSKLGAKKWLKKTSNSKLLERVRHEERVSQRVVAALREGHEARSDRS
eukprot:CAMPEP_0182873104 /NCGR_PEP_ID=MMETSP0034_2-20130328/12120_1 /TAXON_ID=156128 /ORGANISM="Nephroselmis pyriformis, Strain CCMP717" /LENGTH=73 /DNA_ID=CAMNT_0025005733 /DNA_START=293 /DNA_END=511 /DNA_ORIENTATION=-